jgi:eukaryotic-like serine/threonine-protein kinase
MTRIGSYEVGTLIGEGGLGRVHAARDVVLGREVAIKSLRPELLHDTGFVERFRAEATNLARLNHPNITTIHALLEQGRSLYIVMEMVRGQTLEAVLRRRSRGLGLTESLQIFGQAADGLSYAHSMGVIHRDIKPANIMVMPSSGLVKIMDFGIARLRGSRQHTRDGRIIGTLAYMAPEQLRGEATDERSDLYSLAIVLHEMLTGSPPFAGKTEYALIQAQINGKPARLRSLMPAADARLEAALDRALAKKPEQRFASVTEFREAVGGAGRGSPTRDSAIGWVKSPAANWSGRLRQIAFRLRQATATVPQARKRSVLIAGGVLLAAVLVLSGLLKLVMGGSAPVALKTEPSMATTGNSAPVKPANNLDPPRQSVLLAPPKFYPGRTTPALDSDK